MKTNIRKNKIGIIGIAALIVCAVVLVSAPVFAEIVLEIHSDDPDEGGTFTDSSLSSTTHNIFANGDVKHSTDQAKFGISSMYFDGTGGYLSIPDSDDWNFADGDFTIDAWINTFDNTKYFTLFHQFQNASNLSVFWFNKDGPYLQFLAKSGGTNIVNCSGNTWSPINNSWYHVALVREGDAFTFFVDGNDVGSITDTDVVPDYSGVSKIGSRENMYTNGYIDDLYIRKGEALNSADMTYIYNKGGRMFEAERYIDSANTTWGWGYSQGQIDLLARLYSDGKYGLEPTDVIIGGSKWRYYDTLPDQEGKTIGDSYTFEGMRYVYLGSGVGEVPEVPKGVGLFVAMVFGVCVWGRKRLVKSGV